MPIKKYKRSTYRKKTRVSRPAVKAIVEKAINGPMGRVFKHIRHTYINTYSSNASATQHFTLSFALSDLPNYSEYKALYDNYRITKVILRFMNKSPVLSSPTGYVGQLLLVVDHDDDTALTADTDYYQYSDCKIIQCDHSHKFTVLPRVSKTLYNTGVSSGYAQGYRSWVDCANDSVPHYGVKMGLKKTYNSGESSFDLYATYHLEFVGQR